MTPESAARAATGPQDAGEAPKRRGRPHPKTLMDVWYGVSPWGKSCGHQHTDRRAAVNCVNGGDHGDQVVVPGWTIQHLGPGPRRQALST